MTPPNLAKLSSLRQPSPLSINHLTRDPLRGTGEKSINFSLYFHVCTEDDSEIKEASRGTWITGSAGKTQQSSIIFG